MNGIDSFHMIREGKSMKNYLKVIILVSLFAFCFSMTINHEAQLASTSTEGITKIIHEKDVSDIKAVVERNLSAVNAQDIDAYLETIVTTGHKDTQEMMIVFFENNQIEQTLLNFNLITQSTDEIIIRTKQKIIGIDTQEGYRNHIAETLYVFVQDKEGWKIKESSITDIKFID